MTESGWLVPLAIVFGGVVLGMLLLHFTRPRASGAESPPTPAEPASTTPAAAPPAPTSPAARGQGVTLSPQLVGAIKGGAVVALGFVLYLALRDGSAPRGEGMGMTGATGPAGAMTPPAPDERVLPPDHPPTTEPEPMAERDAPSLAPIPSARLDAARAFAAAHPDSRDAKVALGWALVESKGWIEVYHLVEELITARADDPDALTLAATVQLAMGQRERATELLDQVLAAQPDHAQALAWRARVGAPAAAPSRPPDVPRKGPEATPPSATGVSGVVKLAPGAVAPPGATLFLIARNAGVTTGPPLATRKIPAPTFPRAFTLGPEDVMMPGVVFAGPLTLEARLDSDGDARTRDPSDLFAAWPDPIEVGARALVLELAPPGR